MKFRKNWKQFWTLDRRHAEGFTLVELIVVIAILAILGGVAVPAYGGYVTKANKTADQTVVSEVADALTLYYYSNPDAAKGGAYVILTPEGSVGRSDGENGNAAMEAVFGTNWTETAVLKSKDWDSNALGILKSGVNGAATVLESDYMNNGSNALLETVSGLTNAIADKLENSDYSADFSLSDYLLGESANQTAVKAACEASGIKYEELNKANDIQLANMMVLVAAQEVGTTNGMATSELGVLVQDYAMATCYANSADSSEEYKKAYAELTTTIESDSTSPREALNALDAFHKTYSTDIENFYDGDVNEKAGVNGEALTQMMKAISSAKLDADALNNRDLYTSGLVSNYLSSYLAAGSVSEAIKTAISGITLNPGEILVLMTLDANGAPFISCSSAEALLK